jgi:hypothetical protein
MTDQSTSQMTDQPESQTTEQPTNQPTDDLSEHIFNLMFSNCRETEKNEHRKEILPRMKSAIKITNEELEKSGNPETLKWTHISVILLGCYTLLFCNYGMAYNWIAVNTIFVGGSLIMPPIRFGFTCKVLIQTGLVVYAPFVYYYGTQEMFWTFTILICEKFYSIFSKSITIAMFYKELINRFNKIE